MTRDWKFWFKKEEELYYPCTENKGADLRLCFHIGKNFFFLFLILMTWLKLSITSLVGANTVKGPSSWSWSPKSASLISWTRVVNLDSGSRASTSTTLPSGGSRTYSSKISYRFFMICEYAQNK